MHFPRHIIPHSLSRSPYGGALLSAHMARGRGRDEYAVEGILRLIFTLSVSALPSRKFVSSTSRRLLSLPTSSPRGCPSRCSLSFGPVSTSVVPRVSTMGGVRELVVLGAHELLIELGRLGPLCGGRPSLLPINMYYWLLT
jgi:hypothetical protein